ncbi:hypothetical protein B0F90DRAFT_818223 [Multifurca ochricompacta]|uniref:Uncharacterized protein n=1 Tax=Multifurca ochricompacta TaxID=376703 RepID=A0AAD4QSC0_9AGAM|nr:hypothetical protein B0F90DRAFT_818223 [Multifurca ochricompacta]
MEVEVDKVDMIWVTHGRGQGTNNDSECLQLFHFHPSLTLRHSQVALLPIGVNILLASHPHHVRAQTTVTLTIPTTIVLAIRVALHATIQMDEHETTITATTDDMIPGITSLTERTMTTGGTTTATVHATVTMAATDAATNVVVTMKSGITTEDVITETVATTRAIARRVDVPGVVGGMDDRGHLVAVQLPEVVVGGPQRLHPVVVHPVGVPQMPARLWM